MPRMILDSFDDVPLDFSHRRRTTARRLFNSAPDMGMEKLPGPADARPPRASSVPVFLFQGETTVPMPQKGWLRRFLDQMAEIISSRHGVPPS